MKMGRAFWKGNLAARTDHSLPRQFVVVLLSSQDLHDRTCGAGLPGKFGDLSVGRNAAFWDGFDKLNHAHGKRGQGFNFAHACTFAISAQFVNSFEMSLEIFRPQVRVANKGVYN